MASVSQQGNYPSSFHTSLSKNRCPVYCVAPFTVVVSRKQHQIDGSRKSSLTETCPKPWRGLHSTSKQVRPNRTDIWLDVIIIISIIADLICVEDNAARYCMNMRIPKTRFCSRYWNVSSRPNAITICHVYSCCTTRRRYCQVEIIR